MSRRAEALNRLANSNTRLFRGLLLQKGYENIERDLYILDIYFRGASIDEICRKTSSKSGQPLSHARVLQIIDTMIRRIESQSTKLIGWLAELKSPYTHMSGKEIHELLELGFLEKMRGNLQIEGDEMLRHNLNIPINDLYPEISVRLHNALNYLYVHYRHNASYKLGDITKHTGKYLLKNIRNFGRGTLQELEEILEEKYGLHLAEEEK